MSEEWTPSLSASAQAASTAGSPSLSTAPRMSTICRSPVRRRTKPAPRPFHRAGQHPRLEGGAVPQRVGPAGDDRHINNPHPPIMTETVREALQGSIVQMPE